MSKVQLITVPVCKRYITSRLSIAYTLKLVATILTIIIPYILTLSPNDYPLGVWLKRDSYREQPNVHFQYKVVVVAQVKDIALQEPRELYYSTIRELNDLRPESFRSASLSSREVDENLDGLVDSITLKLKLPTYEEHVYGIQALVFVRYRLQNHVKFDMESLAFIQHSGGLPALSYSSRGDLVLRQNMPMRIDKDFTNLYSNKSLINTRHSAVSAQESNIKSIVERYESRDIATHYMERFSLWGGHGLVSNQGKDGIFDLKITIDIPKLQNVVFIPTLSHALLEAWMRYLSLLVIAVFLLRKFLFFIYTNQLLRSHIIIDKVDY